MNRKEDLINYLYKELFDPANEEVGFDRVVSTIRKYEERPLTLADLLGWEEGIEYEVDDIRYKIENGELFYYSYTYDAMTECAYDWNDETIQELQQATKVEESKKDRLLDELQNLVSSERINEIIEELRGLENE